MGNALRTTLRFVRNRLVDFAYIANTMSRPEPKRKACVLYVYADTNKYPHSLTALRKIISRIRGYELTLISIDNFRETKIPTQISAGYFDMGGDNTQWEFSGWKAGLEYLNSISLDFDVAIFVNDSFLNRSNEGFDADWFAHAFNALMLDQIDPETAMGRIWESEAENRIYGRTVGSFLQTHFFALGGELVRKIPFPALTSQEVSQIIPDSWKGEWFYPGNIVSSEMKNFLIRYLTQQWKFKRPANESNWPILRGKTIAMLNERLLTMAVCNVGGRILSLEHGRDIIHGHLRMRDCTLEICRNSHNGPEN